MRSRALWQVTQNVSSVARGRTGEGAGAGDEDCRADALMEELAAAPKAPPQRSAAMQTSTLTCLFVVPLFRIGR